MRTRLLSIQSALIKNTEDSPTQQPGYFFTLRFCTYIDPNDPGELHAFSPALENDDQLLNAIDAAIAFANKEIERTKKNYALMNEANVRAVLDAAIEAQVFLAIGRKKWKTVAEQDKEEERAHLKELLADLTTHASVLVWNRISFDPEGFYKTPILSGQRSIHEFERDIIEELRKNRLAPLDVKRSLGQWLAVYDKEDGSVPTTFTQYSRVVTELVCQLPCDEEANQDEEPKQNRVLHELARNITRKFGAPTVASNGARLN